MYIHKPIEGLCSLFIFSPECPTNKNFMHWIVDAAFYIMLINSENAKMAVSVISCACLWHDEYIYHFYKSNVHAGIFILCLQILRSDLLLMLFVYQVLLPVQASWLLIRAWKISALVWTKKNVMDFMLFKKDINLHQQ